MNVVAVVASPNIRSYLADMHITAEELLFPIRFLPFWEEKGRAASQVERVCATPHGRARWIDEMGCPLCALPWEGAGTS